MNILAIIGTALQVIFLLMKNRFERDEEERKRKEALHGEAKEAIKTNDLSRINALLDKLRK